MKKKLILSIGFTFLLIKIEAQVNFVRNIGSNFITYNTFIIKDSLPVSGKADDTIKKNKFLGFGNEKGGVICVNGLEKLEIAYGTCKKLTASSQLHFYGPLNTEGRIFMIAEQEKEEKSKTHFFESTIDFTLKSFPLHIGYTMGIDQIARTPNTSYSGLAATVYWSDIRLIHTRFHILRTGISYLNLNKHLVNFEGHDSTVSQNKKIEYIIFYQMQPFHITENTSLFSEGFLRLRENQSFGELELGIRNEKILDNLIGLAVRTDWEDFNFKSVCAVVRFNISNPNPKHM